MDTRQVVARFEAERQALALMDHPNIAKVFDAGATDTGRPFFVMELVKGVPITQYCDREKLGTSQRLDLFIRVCQAVQHAHQKGIIHRDLKPSNILVTLQEGLPVPKVIDFGIAKATQQKLTEKTLHTHLQQFIGTPAYMSPEQAEMSGSDIDTRSDIYSLGVLLYELLVGKTPFDTQDLLAAGLDEIRRTIREKEPTRPSTRLSTMEKDDLKTTSQRRGAEAPRLISLLQGDLDWIVMKCLEKDRTRRYDTANGLSMDIQRHLNQEPVVARPQSNLYRFQKLVQRNKLAFGATAAVAAALVLGIVVSTWQAVRAKRAEQQENRSRLQAETARLEAQQAQAQAQQNLYASDMLLASQALEEGNLGRLRELVGKYDKARSVLATSSYDPTELRGWEWRYLWGHSRGDEFFVLRGHTKGVPFALFLDGHTALSFGTDSTMKFWDLGRRSLVESISLSDRPRRAAVSPNGQFIAVGGDTGIWSLWDAVSRRRLLERTNQTGVLGVAFSPDSSHLALADDDNTELWDIGDPHLIDKFSRKKQGESTDGFVIGLAFSPDGQKLAYAQAGHRILVRALDTHGDAVIGESAGCDALTLAFSPDNRWLVSGDRIRITVWDMTGVTPPRHLTNHSEQIVCVSFSPDGRLLASASGDQTIKLWDTKEWREIATLRGHEHEIHSVSFSPDGKSLLSSSKDKTVRVWDVERSNHLVDSFVWDLGTYFPFHRVTSHLWTLQPEGNVVRFMDLTCLRIDSSERVPPMFQEATSWGIDLDGDLVAVSLKEGPIELWAARPFAKKRTVAPSKVPAAASALGETGHWLAVQRTNETTELWDINGNRLVQTFPPLAAPVGWGFWYQGLSFWAGDRWLVRATSSPSGLIELISVPDGQRRLIRHTHTDDVVNFAISEDGLILATAAWDAQVKLWDTRTGRELGTLHGQLVGYLGLAFSPDGSRLAVGGWDGSITLWDLRTYLQVCKWKAHPLSCHWLSFIEGGRTLVSCGDATLTDKRQQMRLWHAPSWEEIAAAEKRMEGKTP